MSDARRRRFSIPLGFAYDGFALVTAGSSLSKLCFCGFFKTCIQLDIISEHVNTPSLSLQLDKKLPGSPETGFALRPTTELAGDSWRWACWAGSVEKKVLVGGARPAAPAVECPWRSHLGRKDARSHRSWQQQEPADPGTACSLLLPGARPARRKPDTCRALASPAGSTAPCGASPVPEGPLPREPPQAPPLTYVCRRSPLRGHVAVGGCPWGPIGGHRDGVRGDRSRGVGGQQGTWKKGGRVSAAGGPSHGGGGDALAPHASTLGHLCRLDDENTF